MTANHGLRFLRPYLCEGLQPASKSAYLRFYATTVQSRAAHRQCVHKQILREFHAVYRSLHTDALGSVTNSEQSRAQKSTSSKVGNNPREQSVSPDNTAEEAAALGAALEQRVQELKAAHALVYPRIKSDRKAISCLDFRDQFEHIQADVVYEGDSVVVRGRLTSARISGSKLVFLDIIQDGHRIQAICSLAKLEASGVTADIFRNFYHIFRRGDVISVLGTPERTRRGELSISATELPRLLSPSLARLPTKLEDRETRVRNRHADLLVNDLAAHTLRARSHIIQYLRDFLLEDNFLEVQTPIIADGAGGAVARPFTTAATEFPDKQLALRIAPEIWLKRLILGGMERVFEIGPSFRNEGLDATHNPEFTTCEFYKSFADLEDLILMTENLVSGLAQLVSSLQDTKLTSLPKLDLAQFSSSFARIEFIPAIEKEIGQGLPDLAADNATEGLEAIFKKHSIALPSSPTLPRLLDKLAGVYIEPHCIKPTFILHHPACMAPLAKSFLDPTTKQLVSARAELFIGEREIANMYEEENSPFEQRAKFVQQGKWKDEENRAVIDEGYLEALQYALPPTGGWGCGIDRLCMLLTGASRISDVLAFGSLRNVVGLGSRPSTKGPDV
ncbi:lysine--tRNA ligase [Coleophoma crateriformis]|uniref:Lysine--tRNA ligase n=1 Tax=Coleophoma crateriformis TaxID=565419 RepID=A0A3D8SMV6_9HELO|nr:lysine--tRNA ligase [Coleophoma crateriformis]